MTTATPTADDIRADFTMVTSDAPDIIKRALESRGEKPADGEGTPVEGAEGTVPKSGDGSGPSVEVQGDRADATDDPDNDDNDDESDDESGETASTKPRKSGLQKRFAKLTSKVDNLGAQNTELMRQNRELMERLGQSTKPTAETKAVDKVEATVSTVEEFTPKPAPVEADYATFGEYIAALGKYTADVVKEASTHAQKQAAKIANESVKALQDEFKAKSARERAEFEASRAAQTFEARLAKLSAEDQQFIKTNPNKVGVTPTGQEIVLDHELGPEIIKYLCHNPKEAARINGLSVGQQRLEYGVIIGRLSSTVQAANPLNTSKPSKTSTATNGSNGSTTSRSVPPLPRGSAAGGRGTGGAMSYKKAAELSFDEYQAARRTGTIK